MSEADTREPSEPTERIAQALERIATVLEQSTRTGAGAAGAPKEYVKPEHRCSKGVPARAPRGTR
jgi:hypothetical protein